MQRCANEELCTHVGHGGRHPEECQRRNIAEHRSPRSRSSQRLGVIHPALPLAARPSGCRQLTLTLFADPWVQIAKEIVAARHGLFTAPHLAPAGPVRRCTISHARWTAAQTILSGTGAGRWLTPVRPR